MKTIWSAANNKLSMVEMDGKKFINVNSSLGYPAYYPYYESSFEPKAKAVLIDLDGTSVKSEKFWMIMLTEAMKELSGNSKFEFSESDLPHIMGYSVSDHLTYCIEKYGLGQEISEARDVYKRIAYEELDEITDGRGHIDAFKPAEGLDEFLIKLKENDIKIALVTGSQIRKAIPEMTAVFKQLNMGDPLKFYDSIIATGCDAGYGQIGTVVELGQKPHPWLYAEALRVGLKLPFSERHRVIGIEDSAAGIGALMAAGISAIGVTDGNIQKSGIEKMCIKMCDNLSDSLEIILGC